VPKFDTYEETLLFTIGIVALRLGTLPEVILEWDEFYFLAWLTILEVAASHIGLNDALRTSAAVWDPKALLGEQQAPTHDFSVKEEAQQAIARAEAISALHARIERRKRERATGSRGR